MDRSKYIILRCRCRLQGNRMIGAGLECRCLLNSSWLYRCCYWGDDEGAGDFNTTPRGMV